MAQTDQDLNQKLRDMCTFLFEVGQDKVGIFNKCEECRVAFVEWSDGKSTETTEHQVPPGDHVFVERRRPNCRILDEKSVLCLNRRPEWGA